VYSLVDLVILSSIVIFYLHLRVFVTLHVCFLVRVLVCDFSQHRSTVARNNLSSSCTPEVLTPNAESGGFGSPSEMGSGGGRRKFSCRVVGGAFAPTANAF